MISEPCRVLEVAVRQTTENGVGSFTFRCICRSESTLYYRVQDQGFSLASGKPIFRLEQEWGDFRLVNCDPSYSELLFCPGTFYSQDEIKLRGGEEIVLGMTTLRVVVILGVNWKPEKLSASETCRVCIEPSSENNPLLSLCRCSGGTKYIHFSCLRTWISTKLRTDSREAASRNLLSRAYACEICKAKYFDHLKEGMPNILSNDYKQPAIVVSMTNADGTVTMKDIDLSKPATVGRGATADLKINDWLISESHCELRLEGPQVVLRDLNSKIGTFLKLHDEVDLLANPRVTLKYQGKIIEAKLRNRRID